MRVGIFVQPRFISPRLPFSDTRVRANKGANAPGQWSDYDPSHLPMRRLRDTVAITSVPLLTQQVCLALWIRRVMQRRRPRVMRVATASSPGHSARNMAGRAGPCVCCLYLSGSYSAAKTKGQGGGTY